MDTILLDGLTLLNQYDYTRHTDTAESVIFILLIIFFLFMASIILIFNSIISMRTWLIGNFVLVIVCTACLFIWNTSDVYTEPSPRYQVTISDDVNFKEFDELYEVINVEGEIYTIKLKDEEK